MRWWGWVAFATLCGWAGSQWLLVPAGDPLPALERQGLGFGVLSLAALVARMLKRQRWRAGRSRLLGMVAGVSLLFFAVPMALVERSREYAPDTSVAVVFALAPVVAVLAVNAFLREEGEMRLLVPALAGFSGVLFLVPFDQPVSLRGWESVAELVAAMLLVVCAGVWLYELLRQIGAIEGFAVAGASNAVALLVWCGVRRQLDWRWSDIAGGVSMGSFAGVIALALTVWLVREMKPVRFSARFLAIPLVTIMEGLVLLRPGVTGRTTVGILLLMTGVVWMLAGKESAEGETLTLR